MVVPIIEEFQQSSTNLKYCSNLIVEFTNLKGFCDQSCRCSLIKSLSVVAHASLLKLTCQIRPFWVPYWIGKHLIYFFVRPSTYDQTITPGEMFPLVHIFVSWHHSIALGNSTRSKSNRTPWPLLLSMHNTSLKSLKIGKLSSLDYAAMFCLRFPSVNKCHKWEGHFFPFNQQVH